MLGSGILPLATGIIALVFAGLIGRQYLQRRKTHQAWWTLGFAMYGVAALLEWSAISSSGWNPVLFQLYVVVSATLVPVLAMGTVSLMTKKRVWRLGYLAYNAVLAVALTYGVLTTNLLTEELAKAGVMTYAPLGGSALSYPRVLSLFLTIPATFVLLWGAVRSIFLFARKKEFAYRMWANVLIATATLIIAGAGGLAKAGDFRSFYLAELTAAVLYLAGFLLASTLDKGTKTAIEHRRAERATDEDAGPESSESGS